MQRLMWIIRLHKTQSFNPTLIDPDVHTDSPLLVLKRIDSDTNQEMQPTHNLLNVGTGADKYDVAINT